GFCKQGTCNPDDELFSTIDKVSDSTRASISAVLGGHTHNYVNTVYHGTRVVIAGHYGQSFALLDLTVHGDTGLTSVDRSRIDDFCAALFSDTKSCMKKGQGEPVAPSELGESVS